MKQSPVNAPTDVGENRTVVAERLNDFLRAKHPVKTAEHVAADTGIAAATIARWLDRGSAPSAWALLALVGAYDAEVMCAVMAKPPAWLVARARQSERERVEAQIAALRARLDRGIT